MPDTNDIDEIYRKLGQAVVGSINTDNWHSAQLHLEVTGTSVDFKGYLNNGERFDAPGGFLLAKSILALHSITTAGGNNRWNRAIFTLTPDGKFDMDFIWDQALQDEIERLAKN